MAKATLRWLVLDVTETKWGHRVMDQVFREGKFSMEQPAKREENRSRRS